MPQPAKRGPNLSHGLLRHLGIEAKENQGNTTKTHFSSSRSNKAKQHREKLHKSANACLSRHAKTQQAQNNVPRNGSSSSFSNPKRGMLAHTSVIRDSNNGPNQGDKFRGIPMPGSGDAEGAEYDDQTAHTAGASESTSGDDSYDDSREDTSDTDKANITPSFAGRIRERLAQDDAEIAELERKLGIKNRKTLPKAFKDDGLGGLLDDLVVEKGDNEKATAKHKRKTEAEEWLGMKRRRAITVKRLGAGNDDDTAYESGGFCSNRSAFLNDDGTDDVNEESKEFCSNKSGQGDGSIGINPNRRSEKIQPKRQRENPYVAPVSSPSVSQKYLPPALRRAPQDLGSEPEAVIRLRKQAHHLVARLSDANMLSMLTEVDKLYIDYPRQYVTDAVASKLLEQVQIEGALSSNVTILIAGFATAIYMTKGPDFGAHFLQQNAALFRQQYDTMDEANNAPQHKHHTWAPSSKRALNLIAVMAELYNFRMVGPNLILDYARRLLERVTEMNLELLLRILEANGHRLHQDDPRAIKGIISLIQPAVLRSGGDESLSVRARYMIHKIVNLKKNDKKRHQDAESSGFGHAQRMRKILSTIPVLRKVEATGPLYVSLVDLEQANRRGKWWLVGASWVGHEPGGIVGIEDKKHTDGTRETSNAQASKMGMHSKSHLDQGNDDVLGAWADSIPDMDDLGLLAREQGMNTETRRSIFMALLSAADCKDAHAQLSRLGLKKHEKREIVNVLIRCAGSEEHYNRYYALVARKACISDRRMGCVFQASLWKLFRRMGEPIFGETLEDEEMYEEDEATSLRRLVNIAKMFGYLVACGSLGLGILKCLNLLQLQTKTRTFVEVLLLSLFDEARQADKGKSGKDGNGILRSRFAAIADNEGLRHEMLYFIDKVLRRSILVNKDLKKRVGQTCDRVQRALVGKAE